jgi:hypothetical protein
MSLPTSHDKVVAISNPPSPSKSKVSIRCTRADKIENETNPVALAGIHSTWQNHEF